VSDECQAESKGGGGDDLKDLDFLARVDYIIKV
jgi:hypothetical protein